MELCSGVMNINGFETKVHIKMYLFKPAKPYSTYAYINHIKYDCQIDNKIITINKIQYKYNIYHNKINKKITISGKEIDNFLHKFCSCVYQPAYFILISHLEI